jgi:hypothetical protein
MKGEEKMESVVYMSIRQTARKTGIAESFLRSAVKDKKIPGFYSGKKFLVNVPRLLAVLEEQSNQNGVSA